MPATAGRVRMPANNRVHSSAALQTHGIWQSAIGYDPYAPSAKEDSKKSSTIDNVSDSVEPEQENAYTSFQGLLALARITNSNSDETRGSCKKCGRVGHLTFQCRNFLSGKEDVKRVGKDDIDDVIREVVLEKLKGEKVKGFVKKGGVESGESSEEEEEVVDEDSESLDSDYDSEMEKIIAKKYGTKVNGKVNVASGRKEDDDLDESSDAEEETKRRRKKRKSRKERRRRRSRSHRHSSDYSDASTEDSGHRRHKRRNRKAAPSSDSDASGSDDPRVARDKKRSEKKSRKSRHEDED